MKVSLKAFESLESLKHIYGDVLWATPIPPSQHISPSQQRPRLTSRSALLSTSLSWCPILLQPTNKQNPPKRPFQPLAVRLEPSDGRSPRVFLLRSISQRARWGDRLRLGRGIAPGGAKALEPKVKVMGSEASRNPSKLDDRFPVPTDAIGRYYRGLLASLLVHSTSVPSQ